MKKIYILFLTAFSFYFSSAQYVWTQKANYGGGAVYDPFVFVIGTNAYSGTGISGAVTVYRTDFWQWDQATNVWTQKADFAGAGRYASRAFSIGSKGYVTSGCSAGGFVNDLWEYDTLANAWTQKNSFPATARYNGVSFALNGKGYFGLGSDFGSAYFSDFWQYDTLSDSWTQMADFTGPTRAAVSKFVINNEAYVGLGSNVQIGANYADFYKYNPDSNIWTRVADFPGAPRNAAYSFAINDTGYIACGYNYTGSLPTNIYKDFWEYNTSLNSWTQLPDFPGGQLFEGIYCEIGAMGYIGVGCDTENTSYSVYTNIFWQYGPVAAPPVASFQSSDTILCANSCINFTDLSTNATSWQWSFTGAAPSSGTDQNPQSICYFVPGNYNVTLIASNASGSDTLEITNYIIVNPIPPTPVITQSGDTLICSTDPAYSSYQWYYYNAPIPLATDTFLVVAFDGNYNIKVTDKNSCSIAVGINVVLGLQNYAMDNTLFLSPNPAADKLVITHPINGVLSVFNLMGEKVLSFSLNQVSDEAINISGLSAGIYFIELQNDKERFVGKFVKQ